MSRKYCIANWKMSMNHSDAKIYFNNLNNCPVNNSNQIVICPSFLDLSFENNITYSLGAQNVSLNDSGAFTGDISAKMLNDLNVNYCIIGHSERREYHNESNLDISKKLNNLINYNITPIVCIGETYQEKKDNKETEVILNQIKTIFNNINTNNLSTLIIAYEPIWAIGTGEIPDINTISFMHNEIKNIIDNLFKNDCNLYILYGGSVNENNAGDIIAVKNVDGFLIGGSPLDFKTFYNIYKKF